MPEIAAWRQAYSQMGLKPTKYRSAGEALLRRFKREDDLPRLHPLVDLCNALAQAISRLWTLPQQQAILTAELPRLEIIEQP